MEDIPFKKRKFWHLSQSGQPTHEDSNSLEHLGGSHFNEFISADGPSEVRNGINVVADMPIEETVASMEPGNLVKTDSVDRQGLLVGELGKSIPVKTNRLHWDLNTMMDEWEEPYAEIFNSQMNNSEYVTNDDDDGIQNGKVTSAVCNVQKNFVGMQCDIGGADFISSGLVSSDPDSIQQIADPRCMPFETKGPDLEKNVLQLSRGVVNTEKTCAAFETQPPTIVISMNGLHDNPRLDHTECKGIGQKKNTANMPVQCEKDISGTPATVLCKLSSQSNTIEKSDSVSVDMPFIGKSAGYEDIINDEGSENLERKSGKDPKLISEDLSSGCNNSNVSGNNLCHMVSVECMSNLQSGYDSPIEDGELREPIAYFWENKEVECSETGQLDNGLVGTDYIDASENNYNNWNKLCDHQDDGNAKGQDNELDDKGLLTREFGPRKYRQKLSSHVEASYMQRQRENENNGSQVDFTVGCQESRSYYSHRYPGSKDHDLSRVRRVYSGPTAGSEMACHDNRRFLKNFSNDIYRPYTRRRLPAERNYSYGSRRRAPPVTGNSNVYNNENSGIYSQLGTRAAKEENDECVPEKYSSRRDLGFSPNFDRAAHIIRPYRKSQSGSSSCSSSQVSHEQKDQRFSGRVSRHSQRQRGNCVEFPRRLKSDDNLRSYKRNS